MKRYLNHEWMILVFLAILVILLRIPSLEEPFDNDSGAIAYHARLIMDGEPLYSTHHPGHHLPGVYYSYVLAFLFEDSVRAVKILVILWTIVNTHLIYLIGKRLGTKKTGFLAAVFFAILSSHVLLQGTIAEIELFANLPITAAILVGIDLIIGRANSWKFVLIGVLCAVAFLFKPIYVSPIAVTIFMVFINAWLKRQCDHAWKTAVYRTQWIGIGFLAIMFLVFGLFAKLDLTSRLLMVFTMGRSHVDQLTADVFFMSIIAFPIIILAINNVIILLLSIGGVIRILRSVRKNFREDHVFAFVGFGIILWYILSIVSAGISRRLWLHYSIIVIPPLAILAAWEIGQIHKKLMAQRKEMRKTLSILTASVLLMIVFFFSGLSNYKHYYHYTQYRLGNESYEQFLINGSLEGANTLKYIKISEYVQSRTNPDDLIYVWSNYVQIYYLANRRAPIEFIWPINVEVAGSYERLFSPQTKYIVVGDSIIPAEEPKWMNEELEKSYTLETVIEDHSIYRRTD